MAIPRTLPTLVVAAVLVLAGCGSAPDRTPGPAGSGAAPSGRATPAATDVPFTPAAWPFGGSACDLPGYRGEIGRIAATDARTVTFTLCTPDGAFLARLAHPSLGILDAAALGSPATDPAVAAAIAGAGPYRIAAWGADNVRLERVGDATGDAVAATVILRWAADPAARSAALQAAAVDGIDAPTTAAVDAVATSPELSVVARPGLATAYLGFGRGAGFDALTVRQAIATGVNRASLLATFPPGSAAADHLASCEVPAGCTGTAFPAFNGPASAAAMKVVGLDLSVTWPLHVPDAPVPGLPDPAGTAGALRDQLGADIGLQLAVDVMPLATFRKGEAAGTLNGLYLDGFAAAIPDAAAFLEPLVSAAPHGLPARRAKGVAALLASAASAIDAAGRGDVLTRAGSKMRASVPVVPLVHASSAAIFRADVSGVTVAPLGEDALGAMIAGDRHQVVFLQASAPTSGWCGDQPTTDAYRLCALVTSGLYAFGAGSLVPIPSLASECAPDPDTRTWTCRLRTTHDAAGRTLDSADVVATFRAMWDAASPQHAAEAPAAFSAWQALFGGFADLGSAR